MIKNNITIKIGDIVADYDDSTAIAMEYKAFDFTDLDNMTLNSTNEFSLPKSNTNRLMFDFCDLTYSNSDYPYVAHSAKLYVDGALVLAGVMYINDVTERYNCVIIEDKSIFDSLKAMPFISPKVGNEALVDSLCSRLVNKWNTTVRGEIAAQYHPQTTQEWIDATYKYCLARGGQNNNGGYTPLHDYTIPFIVNSCGENIPYAAKDDDSTVYSRQNELLREEYDPIYGYGFNLSRTVCYVDYNNDITRLAHIAISPMWASLDLIISHFENISGYTFPNLSEIIREYNGVNNRLFIHLPGVEFDSNIVRVDNRYDIDFSGRLRIVNIGERCDYNYDGENLNDCKSDDFYKGNCWDVLKSIIIDYNLIFNLDVKNKQLIFSKFSDISTQTDDRPLILVEETSRTFKINGIKQKQVIKYKGETDAKMLITCENKNIDEGSETTTYAEIDRYIFSKERFPIFRYKRIIPDVVNKVVTKLAADFTKTEPQQNFIMAIPLCFASFAGMPYDEQCNVNLVSFGASVLREGDASNFNMRYCANYITRPGWNEQYNILLQPICSDHGQYDYFQQIVNKPVVLDISVKKDEIFLHNFNRAKSVKINGYTGRYYVCSISKFNPRVDETINMQVIKLPD
jgi:hypothetical protein